jgi:hypothetical protein
VYLDADGKVCLSLLGTWAYVSVFGLASLYWDLIHRLLQRSFLDAWQVYVAPSVDQHSILDSRGE